MDTPAQELSYVLFLISGTWFALCSSETSRRLLEAVLTVGELTRNKRPIFPRTSPKFSNRTSKKGNTLVGTD
jgi:hypothetical protein